MVPPFEPPHISRNHSIDMLKGAGIVCVVVAHVAAYDRGLQSFWIKAIYTFHMPLFFFLSGYLSTVRRQYGHFFIEKAGQMLIPYGIYFAGIFLINSVVGRDDCGWQCVLFGGRYAYNYLGVFWFVPVLFLTQQLGNFLLARFSVRVNVSIVAGMLCLGFLNDWYLDAFKFPYNLNVVAAAVPFYFCGFLLRHYKLIWVRRAAALVAICGWALVLLGYPNYYDMKNAFYGMPFVTFASALAIVITMLDVFAKLPYWRLLADAGKASLVIMYLHQGVQIFILDHFSHSVVLRLLAALFIPLIVYYLSLRWSFTRALLLGSKADLAELWNYRVHRLR